MQKLQGKKILLISPEAWGMNMLSKHLYAKYLAKQNKVWFLNPVQSSTINPLSSVKCEKQIASDNLSVLSYRNLLPRLNDMSKIIQRKIYKKQARQIQDFIGIDQFDVVWSFDPYRFWDLEVFKADKKLYHTVDFHPGAKYENECCKSSDCMIGVTELVIEETPAPKDKIFKVGHGADIDGFSSSKKIQLPGENKIKACYVGNFHRDIDYDILNQLIDENEDVDFILIGPIVASNLSQGNQIQSEYLEKLQNSTNVFFIGTVPSYQLMGYLSGSDINLVLFKKEREKIHCSPHKLMAYFYSGNITLSNYIDEHKATDPEIIQMQKEQNDIPSAFQEIKSNLDTWNDDRKQKKRIQFALKNSYDKKIQKISEILYSSKVK